MWVYPVGLLGEFSCWRIKYNCRINNFIFQCHYHVDLPFNYSSCLLGKGLNEIDPTVLHNKAAVSWDKASWPQLSSTTTTYLRIINVDPSVLHSCLLWQGLIAIDLHNNQLSSHHWSRPNCPLQSLPVMVPCWSDPVDLKLSSCYM